MPPVPRLHGPGATRTVVAVAAAATGATGARGFLAVRDGSAGVGGVGNILERLGARGVLAARLVSDFAAASMASLMVSPFISIVDRAIIQSASGSMGMKASVAQGFRVLATKPALFLARPDFICTFCLYGATCECCCLLDDVYIQRLLFPGCAFGCPVSFEDDARVLLCAFGTANLFCRLSSFDRYPRCRPT